MTPTEISRLEYKRKFILQNIGDVKKEWYKLDEYREKLRFLFMTAWFGTTAIYLKDNQVSWFLSALLFTITLVFFYLELYYMKASQIRLHRISIMEDWMMKASDQEVLNLNGPLSSIAPSIKEEMKVTRPVFWQGRVSILYILFLILSILLKLVFPLFIHSSEGGKIILN